MTGLQVTETGIRARAPTIRIAAIVLILGEELDPAHPPSTNHFDLKTQGHDFKDEMDLRQRRQSRMTAMVAVATWTVGAPALHRSTARPHGQRRLQGGRAQIDNLPLDRRLWQGVVRLEHQDSHLAQDLSRRGGGNLDHMVNHRRKR